MSLNESGEICFWPTAHYVYVERIGPFIQTARAAWVELGKKAPFIGVQCKIQGRASLYKMQPQNIYRATFLVDSKPAKLPLGVFYEKIVGGTYTRFTLTGPYSQLVQATPRVQEIVRATALPVRDAYYVEHYVNAPENTPEEQLVTQILIPT